MRNGKAVIVKPDRLNPVSADQICVRGRFHYDAVKPRERLTRHLVRQGDALLPAHLRRRHRRGRDSRWPTSIQHARPAERRRPGRRPGRRTKRPTWRRSSPAAVIGTENIDSTAGPVAPRRQQRPTRRLRHRRAAARPAKPRHAPRPSSSSPTTSSRATTSRRCASRTRSSATARGSSSISSRYGEVCDFIAPPPSGSIMPSPQRVHSAEPTGVWLRPRPAARSAPSPRLPQRLVSAQPQRDVIGDVRCPASTASTSTGGKHPARTPPRERRSSSSTRRTRPRPRLAREAAKAVANLAIAASAATGGRVADRPADRGQRQRHPRHGRRARATAARASTPMLAGGIAAPCSSSATTR